MKQEYTIKRCPICHRKRRIYETHSTHDRWNNEYQHYRCSRNHKWRRILPSMERMGRVLARVYLPHVTKLLNNSDTLFNLLNKQRDISVTGRSFVVPLEVR